MRAWFLLPLLAAGCAENEPEYRGGVTSALFPFDGDRTWIYLSTDDTIANPRAFFDRGLIVALKKAFGTILDGIRKAGAVA